MYVKILIGGLIAKLKIRFQVNGCTVTGVSTIFIKFVQVFDKCLKEIDFHSEGLSSVQYISALYKTAVGCGCFSLAVV